MAHSFKYIWNASLAAIIVASLNSADAGDLGRTRIAWGYDAIPNQNFDCAASCLGNVEIFHLETGTYEVEMSPIYLPDPSNLQVSSAEDAPLAYCVISRWGRGARKIVD